MSSMHATWCTSACGLICLYRIRVPLYFHATTNYILGLTDRDTVSIHTKLLSGMCDTMATSAESKDDHPNRPATNNMEVELNLSWFTKRDKPLISIKTKKDDTSSESSSSGKSAVKHLGLLTRLGTGSMRELVLCPSLH